mmetsp:Transcript_19803/g.54564  ORF Transcript_19803/g.54564 Transcript_19803/m.54564 type:complete len:215 (+) Transcript_19803:229-873(+)
MGRGRDGELSRARSDCSTQPGSAQRRLCQTRGGLVAHGLDGIQIWTSRDEWWWRGWRKKFGNGRQWCSGGPPETASQPHTAMFGKLVGQLFGQRSAGDCTGTMGLAIASASDVVGLFQSQSTRCECFGNFGGIAALSTTIDEHRRHRLGNGVELRHTHGSNAANNITGSKRGNPTAIAPNPTFRFICVAPKRRDRQHQYSTRNQHARGSKTRRR